MAEANEGGSAGAGALNVASSSSEVVYRGNMPLFGVGRANPGFHVVSDAPGLHAVEDEVTLATLDLASGQLTVDLGKIGRLEQLIQVAHAMVGHPDAVAARREWASPAVGRLWLLDRNALFAALADRLTGSGDAPVGALAWVDLDNLKYLNDRMGHRVGDLVIEALAERLQRIAGDALVARVGGDEFALLFDGLTPAEAAGVVAGASCQVMGPVVTDVGTFRITFSAGVTDLSGQSADEVLSRADATLYQAKRAGRDQIRVYGASTAAFIGERRDQSVTMEQFHSKIHQFAQEARTDPLTGLPNRLAMDEAVARLNTLPRAPGQVDHILFLDLDRFHAFNHTNGQEAGDEALRTVASLLRENIRDGEVCFRRGGEEFLVLLPATSWAAAKAVGQRIRAAIQAAGIPHRGHPDSPVLTATVVVGAVGARTTITAVAERAASVAFQSKDSGIRNAVLTVVDDD